MKAFYLLLSLWGMLMLGILTSLGAMCLLIMGVLRVRESVMQVVARSWARWLLRLVGCRVRVRGGDGLIPGAPYVFASNHTSALDIPALLSVLPKNFRWIAKKELFDIPVFGYAIRRVGYIPIDRGDTRAAVKSLGMAASRIKDGASVVIFPEGTRSKDGNLLPFKSGGLGLAIRARVPVVPLAITGARKCLPPKSLLIRPGVITVTLGEPIPTAGLKMGQRDEIALQVRDVVGRLMVDAEAGPGPGVA